MLTPEIVGAIARSDADPSWWSDSDVHAIIRHDLAYPASVAIGDRRADDPVLAPLRRAATAKQVRSVTVAATATRVSQILADAGVPSLSYKGPALAVQSTGSFVGRGSTDVDVLIDEDDCPRADAALRQAGCRSRVGYSAAPSRWERFHRPERAYTGLPVTLDLHWRVDPGPGYFATPFAELWGRRVPLDHDGLVVSTLDEVDALLVTGVHGTKERWWRWFWALDAVHQVEGLPPESWVETARRARVAGARASMAMCLAVVAECGGAVPDEALAAGLAPSPRVRADARQWLAHASDAGQVEWSKRASWSRRQARWSMADSPVVAVDGFARAVGRLLADRRAPGAPQGRPPAR